MTIQYNKNLKLNALQIAKDSEDLLQECRNTKMRMVISKDHVIQGAYFAI